MNRTIALIHEYTSPAESDAAFSAARSRYLSSSSSVSVYHTLWCCKRVVVILTNDPLLPLALEGGRRIAAPVELVNLLVARRNAGAGQGKPRDARYEAGVTIFADGSRGN